MHHYTVRLNLTSQLVFATVIRPTARLLLVKPLSSSKSYFESPTLVTNMYDFELGGGFTWGVYPLLRNMCILYALMCLIPLAERINVWACGCWLAGIAGSNPAWGINVCLVWVLCFFRYRSLRRSDHSSRGVVLSVVSDCDLEASTMGRPRPAYGSWSPTREGDIVMFLLVTIKYQTTINFVNIGYFSQWNESNCYRLNSLSASSMISKWRPFMVERKKYILFVLCSCRAEQLGSKCNVLWRIQY